LFSFFKKSVAEYNAPLNFSYENISPKLKSKEYFKIWKNADDTEGIPVFVLFDKSLEEMLRENFYEHKEIDIEKFFEEKRKENIQPPFWGEEDDVGISDTTPTSFPVILEEKIVLAKVPVKKPWEIFEKIPFGGFNECPPANVISAFCKMACEKYGAVPFAICSDTLELSLSRRLTKSEALEFAEKIYYFCPNVFEDDETLYEIANGISKSDFCFLWW
jgi:hypothetical protein